MVALFLMFFLVMQERRVFAQRNAVKDMSRRIADLARTLESLDKPLRNSARLELNVRPTVPAELLLFRADGPLRGELADTLSNDLRGQLGASRRHGPRR